MAKRRMRPSRMGIAVDDGKVRVAIVGVGNCANSFIQGVHYYRDADPAEPVPGLMHVDLGGYHVRDVEFVAAFDIDAEKVGKDLSEAIWSGQNNTIKFAEVPDLGVEVHRGMTHDGLGKYLKQKITKAPGETADIVGILKQTKADVLVCYLPVGSEQAVKWYVEQALKAGVGFVNCLPVFIAREDYWDERFARGRPADHRRRHQVAGRRHHRPPPARPAVPRPRRAARAHLAAQRRRQHGLLQHARARAARLEEGVEDQRRHLDHGPRAARRRRPRRPVGLRGLAHGPQVGPHPARGPLLRRRAAEPRAEARGLGLAELGRDRDRRRPDPQAGAQQRHRGPARRPLQLPDEVAAQPAARRRGPRADRGVHRRDTGAGPPTSGRPIWRPRRRSRPRPLRARRRGHRAPLDRARVAPSLGSAPRGERVRSTPRRRLGGQGTSGGGRRPVGVAGGGARVPPADPRGARAADRALRPPLEGRARGRTGRPAGARDRVRAADAARPAPAGGAGAARRESHAGGAAGGVRVRHRPRPRPVRPERRLDGAASLALAQRRQLPRAERADPLDPGGAAAGRDLLRPPRRPHRHARRGPRS